MSEERQSHTARAAKMPSSSSYGTDMRGVWSDSCAKINVHFLLHKLVPLERAFVRFDYRLCTPLTKRYLSRSDTTGWFANGVRPKGCALA
jgi:hypothetical protein